MRGMGQFVLGYARESTALFSGGPDSLIGWWEVAVFRHEESVPLAPVRTYVELGHRYARAEKTAILRIMGEESELFGLEVPFVLTGGVDLSRLEKPSAYIPARNLFLALAAAWSGAREIWLVVQRDEMTLPDRSPAFLRETSDMLSTLFQGEVSVQTPFPGLDKTGMVARFLDQLPRGSAERLLRASWSCYEGGSYPVHCGACKACVRRYIAFILNGVEEEYRKPPASSMVAQGYLRAADAGEYSPQRCLRIEEALAKRC